MILATYQLPLALWIMKSFFGAVPASQLLWAYTGVTLLRLPPYRAREQPLGSDRQMSLFRYPEDVAP